MKAAEVLQQMNEIERTVYATQSWWPQLRRLLEQTLAVEEAAQQSVEPTNPKVRAGADFRYILSQQIREK